MGLGSDDVVLLQELFDIGALDLAEGLIEGDLLDEGELHVGRLFAVAELDGGIEQVADVVDAAPDLRHAAVDVQEGIDSLHAGAHGILGGEDGVARGLGELAEEGEVHGAVGHDLRAVAVGAGHKERVDIRHHDWDGIGAVRRQFLDLVLGHADVVEPLHADLLAGALAHGLFDIIARLVGEEGVDPDEAVVLGLRAELRLAVDGPAHQPGGILHGDDAAGDDMAGERVALADIFDIGDDLLVEGLDGGAHPVGLLGVIAELVGMAEGRILRGDLAPHVPAAAGFDLVVVGGGLVLAAAGGIFDAAAVGDEDEVVLGEVDGVFLAVAEDVDALGELVGRVGAVKLHVHDLHAVVELDTEALEILDHREDHGLILVVLREAQSLEVGQTADVVDIALDIELHLERAVPVFKGEHRAPVEPEVGRKDLVIEEVGDLLVLQLLVGGEEELHDLHRALVGDVELAVGVGVLAAVFGGAAEGVVRVLLVEPVILVEDAHALGLDGGDGVEQVPHDLEMVVHLAAAAHDVADVFEFVAVAGAAGDGILLENVHPVALHLAVADEIAGRGQRGQAAADDIGRFVVHALGLFWSCKCFIVAARIIHDQYLHKKSGNDVLCFPFDGMSILQVPKKRHKQKMPGDKVLITGREIV